MKGEHSRACCDQFATYFVGKIVPNSVRIELWIFDIEPGVARVSALFHLVQSEDVVRIFCAVKLTSYIFDHWPSRLLKATRAGLLECLQPLITSSSLFFGVSPVTLKKAVMKVVLQWSGKKKNYTGSQRHG